MNGHVTARGVRESNSVIKGLFEEIMNEDFFSKFYGDTKSQARDDQRYENKMILHLGIYF